METSLEEKINDIIKRLEDLEKEEEENRLKTEENAHNLETIRNKFMIIESNQQSMRAEFLLKSAEKSN